MGHGAFGLGGIGGGEEKRYTWRSSAGMIPGTICLLCYESGMFPRHSCLEVSFIVMELSQETMEPSSGWDLPSLTRSPVAGL